MSDEKNEAKRVIVDEDWKAQVQRERAQHKPEEKPARGGETLPPASFTMLLSTLSIQVLVALGDLPMPGSDKHETNLPQAKHFIDTLEILQEKTKGNLTADEGGYLESLLFDLRMRYVERAPAAPTA
jgi:hypothetical protein